MDWMWTALFLLGVTPFTYGRDPVSSDRTSHVLKRNIVVRPTEDMQSERGTRHALYHYHDDAQGSPLSISSLPSGAFGVDSYEGSGEEMSYQGLYRGFPYDFEAPQPILAEQWDSSVGESENASPYEFNKQIGSLNAEERDRLQKRLQMKGLGLLGSPKGPQSFGGFSKSFHPQGRGLTLSIDLGIKALRDAIKHAKAQEKTRLHKIQAQKNQELLHSIGKRSAPTATDLHRL